MWLLLALSGPLLWAISTHIDKYLVERYFKNSDTAVLMLFTAVLGVMSLPVIAAFQPGIADTRMTDGVVMTLSGILYMGAMLLYLRAVQEEEASVIAPLFQTSTLFTLLLAFVFLGETLNGKELLGVALVLIGALSSSANRKAHFNRVNFRVVGQMLGCTFVMALATVLFKFFAIRDQFWITTFWTFAGQGLFGLAILLRPAYRAQFLHLFAKHPGPFLAINGANELINLSASLGVRYASLLVPVALVSVVSSTTTLFVFGLGIVLTVFFPQWGREDLSRGALLQKALAALLVTAGLILLGGQRY